MTDDTEGISTIHTHLSLSRSELLTLLAIGAVIAFVFVKMRRKRDPQEVPTPSSHELDYIRQQRAKSLENRLSKAETEKFTTEERPQLPTAHSESATALTAGSGEKEAMESFLGANTCTTDSESAKGSIKDVQVEESTMQQSQKIQSSVVAQPGLESISLSLQQDPAVTSAETTNGANEPNLQQSRLLKEFSQPQVVLPTTETNISTTSMSEKVSLAVIPPQRKNPPTKPKRPACMLPQEQLASDVLSTITKHTVLVVAVDQRKYSPRSNTGLTSQQLVVEMHTSTIADVSVVLPRSFRDIALWFARANALFRNGYPPHLTKDGGDQVVYQEFETMLQHIMEQLVQQVRQVLRKDMQHAPQNHHDEEDLFSEYLPRDEPSTTPEFLSLLEETPSPIDKPFLDQLLPTSQADLASSLLHTALMRLTSSPLHHIAKRANVVSLLLLTPSVTQEWSLHMQQNHAVWIRPLLEACAICIPNAGQEESSSKPDTFSREMMQVDDFPVCVYSKNQQQLVVLCQQTQTQMQAARRVAESLLRKAGKETLFRWLAKVVQDNESMALLLRVDLLNVTTEKRSYLLGLASAVLGLCTENLVNLFSGGKDSFDYRYLDGGRLHCQEPKLVRSSSSRGSNEEVKFTGGTEFFFLLSGLLRVSLYPALRMEASFGQKFSQVFAAVRRAAKEEQTLPPSTLQSAKAPLAALMGWNTLLDDADFVANATKFSILQLQWLVANKEHLVEIPDFICKNPATWLAHVAQNARPNLLQPYQATATIEASTKLLQIGTDKGFSPVVIDSLVNIVAAFVNAGVSRARRRQRRRGLEDDFDDRYMDLYVSFDANDLGVTVFTNELVAKELCPTLIGTFSAVDKVVGLDVDREQGFDKFSAKGRIAELLLRLWSHPNGLCRNSIVQMDDDRIAQFVKEIEIAIGVMFDFSCNRMADITSGFRRQLSHREYSFLLGQGRSVASEISFARLWIMLLCKISEEPRIRKILGSAPIAKDLASLMIHFIDILTDADGGVHASLNFSPNRSASYISVVDSLDADKKQQLAAHVAKSRFFIRNAYGLDIAAFCHQFLALMTCWHREARSLGSSSILTAFACHEDYEEERYQNILRRLIEEAPQPQGSEGDCARLILERDGHIDLSIWAHNYVEDFKKISDSDSQQRMAKKDHMDRNQIELLATVPHISAFLSDAAILKKSLKDTEPEVPDLWVKTTILAVEEIVASSGDATDETYGERLSDWRVTSESFASKNDPNTFAHYYDETARSAGVACSGKVLAKEARRCHKNLPVPHPNSAAFVCFAEERMDLARACITGPVDTPYAYGIFVFEVLFPEMYPSIPPLATFITTGGGQVRFNPNLYSDGKICVSLLGTFHAQDESQKWNPDYSSLAQVLLSIQTQLLVEEPYFNEPGNEARQGTDVGAESSNRYNLVLQLATLRHAILAPLKEAPVGLEEICNRHFSLCRKRITIQAHRWMNGARGTNLFPRFERVFAELVSVLTTKFGSEEPALSPSASDIDQLQAFVSPGKTLTVKIEGKDRQQRKKPVERQRHRVVQMSPPVELTEVSVATAMIAAASILKDNPWANPVTSASVEGKASDDNPTNPSDGTSEEDDDFYS